MLVRQRISEERKKNGFSSADLASRLGVNKGTVSRWENGYIKKIPGESVRQLAEIFNISLSDLISDDTQYFYLLPKTKKKHSPSSDLSDDENAMISWYRDLSDQEKELVSRLWRS